MCIYFKCTQQIDAQLNYTLKGMFLLRETYPGFRMVPAKFDTGV